MIENKACLPVEPASVDKKPSETKPYTQPSLKVYGDVRKLTLGATGSIGDGDAGGTKRPKN